MANCVIRDWQGKEAGKAALELKVAKESSATDLVHRAVVRDGERGEFEFVRLLHQPIQAAGPIEQ